MNLGNFHKLNCLELATGDVSFKLQKKNNLKNLIKTYGREIALQFHSNVLINGLFKYSAVRRQAIKILI
jgi:hypothetical protein